MFYKISGLFCTVGRTDKHRMHKKLVIFAKYISVATMRTCPQPPSYRALLQNPPRQRAYSDKSRLYIPFPVIS